MSIRVVLPLILAALALSSCGRTMSDGKPGSTATPARATTVAPPAPVLGAAAAGAAAGAGSGMPDDTNNASRKPIGEK